MKIRISLFISILFVSGIGINNFIKNKDNNLVSNTEINSSLMKQNKEQIIQLSMGETHSSALTKSGDVYTWGRNNYGQLGDGSINSLSIPTKITSNFNLLKDEYITQLVMGEEHSSALTNKGTVYTWGRNNYGQLGDNSKADKQIPTDITSRFNLTDEKITQLSMGRSFSSALTDKGSVYTWGRNDFGQLGDNSKVDKQIPTDITSRFNLTDEKITQLNFGSSYSSALTDKGSVYTWGRNDFGQLGDGTKADKQIPTNITNRFSLTDEKITQLRLGLAHSSALTNKNNVYTWGYNNAGQLGDKSNNDKQIPTKITNNFSLIDEKITQLSLGSAHSSALTNKNNVYTWGDNSSGKLGNNSITSTNTPENITTKFKDLQDEKITELNMGAYHSSALTDKGNVYTWGENNHNQLGHSYSSLIPGNVSFPYYVSDPEVINLTSNSATIKFNLISSSNTNDTNVTIWNNNNKIITKTFKSSGTHSIVLNNLKSSTKFIGLTIEADSNGKIPIPDFETSLLKSKVVFDNISNETLESVTINFTVEKNDQKGNVVIKDNDENIKGKEDNVSGDGSILIKDLEPGTTFSGWTIEVDGNKKVSIKDFKTQPNTSSGIEKYLEIKPKGKIKLKDTKITLIYEIEKWLNGSGYHVITYKDGTQEQKTSSFDKSLTEKTYVLNQPVENIEKIETFYEMEGHKISLETYTGTAEKVLGVITTWLSLGIIIATAFSSITAITLILLIIYFLVKKNKLKTQ